ncbi:MAG: prephenate dehydratase [Pseudomonadota bacterium]
MTDDKRAKISFQGEFGANSDFACRDVYPDMEPLPCSTFEDAFAAVKDGQAELAMIPIDNSLAGRVADIHHLLPDSNLHIIKEYFLPIHFQLMALPGVARSDITHVYSHVHALGQCRRVIRENGWTGLVAGDTAGAAKRVAERGDRQAAALAPELAAELYGLDIIERDVEDAAHNTTRFVVLSREPHVPEPGGEGTVMSFVFRVRNVPAALYKAMGGFATNGVNMTKLESYQLDGRFTATQFYAEIDGHPDEPGVQFAMEELGFFSTEIRVLGVYEASAFRRKAEG